MEPIECVSIVDLSKQYNKFIKFTDKLENKFKLMQSQRDIIDEIVEEFNELYYIDGFE